MINHFKVAAFLFSLNFILSGSLYSQTGKPDTLSANKYFNKSLSLEGESRIDSAMIYAEKAQAIYSGYFGEKSLKNADALHLVGRLFYDNNNFEPALEYTFRALGIRKAILGPDHIVLAKSYYNMGLINFYKGETEKALPFYLEALRIRKINLNENHPDLARSYNNIGLAYFYKGEYDNALDNYNKALKIIVATLGENSLDASHSYFDIGASWFKKGDYSQSLEYHLKSLKIRKVLLGENNIDVASSYDNAGIVYCYKGLYPEALENNTKALQIRIALLGDKHPDVASSYLNLGNVYANMGQYDKVLDYLFRAVSIYKQVLGENDPFVASGYNNIGVVYQNLGEYDKALEYQFKALKIRKDVLGEKHPEVAESYINIAMVYRTKGELDKALDYSLKVSGIYNDLYGQDTPALAATFTNIGDIYSDKGEYNKALEYLLKACRIRIKLLGEDHQDVAKNYLGIGGIYYYMKEYESALAYYMKAIKIYQELFGEKHPDLAWGYVNTGILYSDKGDYDEALRYYFKALGISTAAYGDKHPDISKNYINIGNTYCRKGEYDKALDYFKKALQINKEVFGEHHSSVAQACINIGNTYMDKRNYDLALKYFQKGVSSCVPGFNDTLRVSSIPKTYGSLNWSFLLEALALKARIFAAQEITLSSLPVKQRESIALAHYMACDSLIGLTRRAISTQSDKLALGELSSQIYKEAIDLLLQSEKNGRVSSGKKVSGDRLNQAFYFSEKNKSAVLLEALAGQEAQHFAGIPDTLIEKEQELKEVNAYYARKIAETVLSDSMSIRNYEDKLFRGNLSIDSLIKVFEQQYPDYHNLKYNTKNRSVAGIQKLLDGKTAMISYFTGDSTITVFTLTSKNLSVKVVPQMKNLGDSIEWYRYALTNPGTEMQRTYRRLGYSFYQQLFPEGVLTGHQIENLIIIPDGELAIIPFETLLTDRFSGDITSYSKYPYLVKKFNIRYSYSANLYYQTSGGKNRQGVGITKLDDWLALAPVFDSPAKQTKVLPGQELNRQLSMLKTDSLMKNRSIFNGNYIAPLPATETETETIFKLFEDSNFKAKILLHDEANEKFIKSADIRHYRVIHFATHGFINSEKPELSGLLLAQDTTGGEDGILYSAEIYNLKLNADLVVLSACETGLGKIQKGEGIIGLTRALLYAGARNIVVSLWQVADESTSDLMVDYYKSLLSGNKLSNSEALRDAKLRMISTEKYSHPFFWSPFILIGN